MSISHVVHMGAHYLTSNMACTELRLNKAKAPLGVRLMRLIAPIHFGDIGGLFTRILWVVIGLTPGILFVTSLLLWWNRSLSKKWRRQGKSTAREKGRSTELVTH